MGGKVTNRLRHAMEDIEKLIKMRTKQILVTEVRLGVIHNDIDYKTKQRLFYQSELNRFRLELKNLKQQNQKKTKDLPSRTHDALKEDNKRINEIYDKLQGLDDCTHVAKDFKPSSGGEHEE